MEVPMARRRLPEVGSRVNLQMFASDLLSHQGLVTVENHLSGSNLMSVVFRDGAGVHVAISGDRSSLRMVLSAALADLGPEHTDMTVDEQRAQAENRLRRGEEPEPAAEDGDA
jgi:hypothetical protein